MYGYYDLFPDKIETELRTAYFPDEPDLPFPAGMYAFFEYYCTDLSCHCQRLIVKVRYMVEPGAPPDEVATISYTWNESAASLSKGILPEPSNPFLDPFHRQAAYADELMDFWYDMLCRDDNYADRLKRHYAELRREYGSSDGPTPSNELLRRARNTAVAERKRRSRALRQKQQKKRRGGRRPK